MRCARRPGGFARPAHDAQPERARQHPRAHRERLASSAPRLDAPAARCAEDRFHALEHALVANSARRNACAPPSPSSRRSAVVAEQALDRRAQRRPRPAAAPRARSARARRSRRCCRRAWSRTAARPASPASAPAARPRWRTRAARRRRAPAARAARRAWLPAKRTRAAQPELGDLRLERLALRPVADDHELDRLRQRAPCASTQVAMALPAAQRGDDADERACPPAGRAPRAPRRDRRARKRCESMPVGTESMRAGADSRCARPARAQRLAGGDDARASRACRASASRVARHRRGDVARAHHRRRAGRARAARARRARCRSSCGC